SLSRLFCASRVPAVASAVSLVLVIIPRVASLVFAFIFVSSRSSCLTVVKQVGCQRENSRFREGSPETEPMPISMNRRNHNEIKSLSDIAECETNWGQFLNSR